MLRSKRTLDGSEIQSEILSFECEASFSFENRVQKADSKVGFA